LDEAVTFKPPRRLFELPPLLHTLDATFSDIAGETEEGRIGLAGYNLTRHEATLDLTLWWVAQQPPRQDYNVFVHLFDPAYPDDIVTQHDGTPRQGRYPTSRWLSGEVVSDTVRLDLGAVPPGSYRLALGWYDPLNSDRLIITPGDTPSLSLPGNRLVLPTQIEINGVPRE
jgi:hypothetical protein